jgi:nucleoside recognition membrane protein YjiH
VLVVLRIVAYVAVILIGASLAAFLVTRDRRFLRFAWQIVKYGLVFAGVVLALFAVERLAVL